MVLSSWRVHMEPFSIWHDRHSNRRLHYISRDHPNAHELTYHIWHPSPESGLRSPAPREIGFAGVIELSPCRLLVQQAVFQRYSKSVWRTEPVSCGRAQLWFENQWNPTNLNTINKFNNQHNYNNINNHNYFNKIRQYIIMTVMTIAKYYNNYQFTIIRIVI